VLKQLAEAASIKDQLVTLQVALPYSFSFLYASARARAPSSSHCTRNAHSAWCCETPAKGPRRHMPRV
jgi:hypothetical protein